MIAVEKTQRVKLAKLKPYPKNPRQGDVGAIIESLKAHGQFRALVVNSRTGEILAGNHTFRALSQMGAEEALVHYVDVDEDQAARIVLVDNRSNDLASYDDDALADLLASLPSLEGTGYSSEDVQGLLPDDRAGTDTAPRELPEEPRTRLGDLWVLGEHRLLCGSSTVNGDVSRLMGVDLAHLIYTDPPYGMSYRSANLGGIQGDDLRGDDLFGMVRDALRIALGYKEDGAAVYVWCTWRTYPEFVAALAAAGVNVSACIVWNKGRIGPGSAHYRPQHEFCLYCRPDVENEHDLCIYCQGTEWSGGRGSSDVWDVPRDRDYVHPTQKPTALAERGIKSSTAVGAIVLDCFGGSGSTLIAADNLNRRARLMELDPAYCDVIVDRWERHTGRSASLASVVES